MAETRKIIIIGAGIGGLTAALALLRRGLDVEVYERASVLSEIGAGLHCSPNGTRVLIGLGLAEEMTRIAVVPRDRDVRMWNTGQIWPLRNHGKTATQRYGAPYLVMHRGDLHAMLVNAVRALKSDAIHLSANCESVHQDDSSVTATFTDGRQARGDCLVAADGVHSVVRRQIFDAEVPSFTGVVAWRGLVPIERLPHISAYSASNWIGPNGSITLYGVRGGSHLNFVGLRSGSAWQTESWIEPGSVEDCLRDFEGWHEDVLAIMRNIDTPYKWGLFLHEPARRWSKGRVTLLGDACHATLPYLGQGGNMALEDAMVLARCLAQDEVIEAALQRYEQARRERTTRMVHQAAEQGRRVSAADLGDAESASRYVEKYWSPDSVAAWYDWIYDYDAVTVPL